MKRKSVGTEIAQLAWRNVFDNAVRVAVQTLELLGIKRKFIMGSVFVTYNIHTLVKVGITRRWSSPFTLLRLPFPSSSLPTPPLEAGDPIEVSLPENFGNRALL